MADDRDKPRVTLPSESTEIPGLPQRNSNADPPSGFTIVGSGFTATEGEQLAHPDNSHVPREPPLRLDVAPPPRRGKGETVRETVTRSIREVQSRMASPNAPPSGPSTEAKERPGTKTLDYIALGLLLAPPAVVLDMYLKDHSINWRKVAIATPICWLAGGLVVLASNRWQSWRSADRSVLSYLIAAEGRFWVKGLIIAAAMGFALALSSFLSDAIPPSQNPSTADEISRITDSLKARVSELRAALEDMTHQRDSALRQNPPQSSPSPDPDSGPITWNAELGTWTTGDNEGPLLLGIVIQGRTSGFVDLRDAYIISEVTGEKKVLQVSTAPGPMLSPINEINQIPPGASLELWVTFKPAIRPTELLTLWHRFHFHADYSRTVYDRIFDVTALANQFPNMGPHVTKKVPAK
jgi:hypothetical protein